MKKNRIPMILLFLTGLFIVGACEKDDDPVIGTDPLLETYEEQKSPETHEEADEYKRESPGDPQV